MILRDEELLALVRGSKSNPPIVDFSVPSPPFGTTSPIQPSSLDLTIGRIFLPEASEDAEGGMNTGALEHWLKPGHTAVVVTKESLNFPSDIAAFGFPPTRISGSAILMTNPGHIDPGFKGYLTFTVINMGKSEFRLAHGETIVTCLLTKLSKPSKKDYTALGHVRSNDRPSRNEISRLSHDFIQVDKRATEIAAQVANATLEKQRRKDVTTIGIGVAAVVITLVASWIPVYFSAFMPAVWEVKERAAQQGKLIERVKVLEAEVKLLKNK